MIIDILQIIYLYGLLPFLIGVSLNVLFKHYHGFPFIYVSGYMVYLALFGITTDLVGLNGQLYNRLTQYWKSEVCILTAIVCMILLASIFVYIRKDRTVKSSLVENIKGKTISFTRSRDQMITVGLTILLILLSVGLLVPHAFDDTPELARLTLKEGSFFSVDQLSDATDIKGYPLPGCIHLFYAFAGTVTGLNVTTIIHLMMPVFMIPLFVCSYIVIASMLFPDAAKQRKLSYRFVWLIILFYVIMLPLESHIALTPYRNIWNGITFTASCLIPLFVSFCVDFVRRFSVSKGSDCTIAKLTLPEHLIILLCLSFSMQLCVDFGLVLCCVFLVSSIAIVVVHVIKRRYSNRNSLVSQEGGNRL